MEISQRPMEVVTLIYTKWKELETFWRTWEKIDANEKIQNMLDNHKDFAKGMSLEAWVNKVLPGHDGDYKCVSSPKIQPV